MFAKSLVIEKWLKFISFCSFFHQSLLHLQKILLPAYLYIKLYVHVKDITLKYLYIILMELYRQV